MLTTLNIRQLRALAAVAPGTLAIRGDSTYARTILITSEEDRYRSGIERLEVDQDGNVREYRTGGRVRAMSYSDIIAQAAEAAAGI